MADDEAKGPAARPEPTINEVLPKAGLVYSEKSSLTELHCKPKIMPIKSAALERLEAMESEVKVATQTPQSRAGGAPASRAGRPTSARPISAAGRNRQAGSAPNAAAGAPGGGR